MAAPATQLALTYDGRPLEAKAAEHLRATGWTEDRGMWLRPTSALRRHRYPHSLTGAMMAQMFTERRAS